MHIIKPNQAKDGLARLQRKRFGIPYSFFGVSVNIFLGGIIISLCFVSWKVQDDIQSFQQRIQSLQENIQASKQSNSLKKDNETLALEKDVAGLEKEGVELQSNSNIAVFQALGTLVVVLGFISTWRSQDFAEKNATEAQRTANTVQITHRFTEAVNQLGNDKIATRLGGIYALQSIATESADYFLTVLKILCGFVRDQSSYKAEVKEDYAEERRIGVDIQSALDFIGQSNHLLYKSKECDSNKPELNLSFTNLGGAKLARQCFAKVSFRDTFLAKADFLGSCLCGTRFTNAVLEGADFRETDLTRASFKNADLTKVNFRNANLEGVVFLRANLKDAVFQGAKAININQIKQAENWQLAKFDPDICAQLGLAT